MAKTIVNQFEGLVMDITMNSYFIVATVNKSCVRFSVISLWDMTKEDGVAIKYRLIAIWLFHGQSFTKDRTLSDLQYAEKDREGEPPPN
jgi:hypothetical protein